MDLKTVRLRLRNNFYRREEALLWDLQQISKNAGIFNGEGEQIVKDARDLYVEFQRFVNDGVDPTTRLGR
jgi:hypothetical protein